MRGTLVALSLLVSATVAAKPLPDGMKVSLVKQKLVVSQNGASAPLGDAKYPVTTMRGADLSDDGKTIRVKTDNCDGMLGDDPEATSDFSLAQAQARLENVAGMKFHTKKQYADAITHFTAAIQADPQPVYVTNLLSAQAMSGKLDDADKTLASYGKAMAPWLAWRLAVDPELKKLAGRPSTKLGAAKAGTAKSAKLAGAIAYSPLGFAATELRDDTDWGSMGGDSSSSLVFVELATGKETLRLPTFYECDTSEMSPATPAEQKKCVKKHAAQNIARRKVADALLASLGFDLVPDAPKDPKADENIKTPEGKKLDVPDLAWSVFFVPKYTVFVERDKLMTDCAGDGDLHFSLTVSPRT